MMRGMKEDDWICGTRAVVRRCAALWHFNKRDVSYWLVGLGTALVTGVGGDGHHGLDLGGPGHDTPHVDQLPDAVGTHVAHHFGFGRGGGLEVELAGREATQSH